MENSNQDKISIIFLHSIVPGTVMMYKATPRFHVNKPHASTVVELELKKIHQKENYNGSPITYPLFIPCLPGGLMAFVPT